MPVSSLRLPCLSAKRESFSELLLRRPSWMSSTRLGIAVEKKKIDVPEHAIKVVGSYVVNVKLYGGESAELKVEVKGAEKEEE